MVADAEVLAVVVEILTDLRLGAFEVKLNHRKLLDAMLEIAGAHCGGCRSGSGSGSGVGRPQPPGAGLMG